MPRQPGADHRKVRFNMAARRLINYQGIQTQSPCAKQCWPMPAFPGRASATRARGANMIPRQEFMV